MKINIYKSKISQNHKNKNEIQILDINMIQNRYGNMSFLKNQNTDDNDTLKKNYFKKFINFILEINSYK